jgi:hypothetical protein
VALNYTSQSLDMMDRIFGMYLTQMMPIYSAALAQQQAEAARGGNPSVSLARSQRRSARSGGSRARSFPRRVPASLRAPASSALTTMSGVVGFLSGAANLYSINKAFQVSANADASWLDKAIAIGGGIEGYLSLTLPKNEQQAASALGAMVSTVSVLQDLGNVAGDLAFIMTAADNTDPSVLQQAQQDLNNAASKAGVDGVETLLKVADLYTAGWAGNLSNWFGFEKEVTETVLGTALQSADLLLEAPEIAEETGFTEAFNTALEFAGETLSPFPSDTAGFTMLSGQVNLANSEGPILSGLAGMVVGSDYGLDRFWTIADPSGAYSMFVPLGDPSFDYVNADLEVWDSIDQDELNSVDINLSDLTTAVQFHLPTTSATCVDTDADDPDSDDPDCDGDSASPQSLEPGPKRPMFWRRKATAHRQSGGVLSERGGAGQVPETVRAPGSERSRLSTHPIAKKAFLSSSFQSFAPGVLQFLVRNASRGNVIPAGGIPLFPAHAPAFLVAQFG